MPYEVRKVEGEDKWEVVNKDSGDVKAKHTSKEKAEAQVKLLEGIEHGWRASGE
jgi:16S rRNA U1498 N3-methylase RsmE